MKRSTAGGLLAISAAGLLSLSLAGCTDKPSTNGDSAATTGAAPKEADEVAEV